MSNETRNMRIYKTHMLITDLIADYLRHESDTSHLRASSLKNYAHHLRALKRDAGAYDVSEITTRDLQVHFDHLQGGLSHASYVKHKTVVSALFAYAVRSGQRADGVNPARGVRVPKGNMGHDTHAYSLEQLRAILALPGLSVRARAAVGLAGFAGLRASEIRGLNWSDYNETTVTIQRSVWRSHVSEPKTLASRASVPVVPQLRRLLASLPREHASYMLASHGGGRINLERLAIREIRPALAANNIPWYGWHAFRRGLATNLHSLGVQDKVIQRVLRHESLATTLRAYVKTDDASARQAMSVLENAI